MASAKRDSVSFVTDDKQIGRNLASLRREISQADLARLMRERGWKWAQNTVSAIESGDRPLRLSEAEDVADILEVDRVQVFLSGDAEFRLESAIRRVNDSRFDVSLGIADYQRAQLELALAADALAELPADKATIVRQYLTETPTDLIEAGWSSLGSDPKRNADVGSLLSTYIHDSYVPPNRVIDTHSRLLRQTWLTYDEGQPRELTPEELAEIAPEEQAVGERQETS